ncbi:CRAL-TRIO domain-containing protein [Paramicrosporidium saccamoebae]|uniref:CRAL-TRIO domain-containing protein n=1 Tax=Paramicrosporidium saccamoebae TaxID=1246581 RepID=A0A2H9TMU0_9FUNG|nr:CRAL-TRIO domain-containing protein [Paramicrosporidium saccamoebae]
MKTHPEVTRATALKFMLGRKFVEERAEECYRNYQKTVLDHHFEHVTVSDVLEELRTQKLYIPGTRDRSGAALFIINAGKHVPGQFPNESTLRLAFYLGEVLTSNPKTSEIGVTVISNMEGMEWANFDNQFQRTVIDFFQSNIPARVKNIILYKSPWWVSMLVKMVSPFLKQKMRDRIHICGEGDLDQFIEKTQLPNDLGGTFVYDHDVFIRKEMTKVPSTSFLKSGAASPKMERLEETHTPPPGTIMLVSDELATELQAERQRVLAELDDKIRRRRESLQSHTLPLDISKIVRSKSARMSVDMDALPSLEPNILHLRDARIEGQASMLLETEKSPLAERPGEDYDPEKLTDRIRKSIRKDRGEFLKKMRRQAQVSGASKASYSLEIKTDDEMQTNYGPPDEQSGEHYEMQPDEGPDGQSETSERSLVPVEREEVGKAPLLPPPKSKFTTIVPASRNIVSMDVSDANPDEPSSAIVLDSETHSESAVLRSTPSPKSPLKEEITLPPEFLASMMSSRRSSRTESRRSRTSTDAEDGVRQSRGRRQRTAIVFNPPNQE